MTWHQWHAEYPTDSRTGTSRARAAAKASSDHGHQSTGLSACCSRYGLVAFFSRLAMFPSWGLAARAGPPGGTLAAHPPDPVRVCERKS